MSDDTNQDRWHEVDALFAEALDRPPEEWETFLTESCGDDAALRREVEALLQASGEADALFEQPSDDLLHTLWHELAEDLDELAVPVERSVGPYRLVEEIGRGGMSVVYLAERDDGHFQQQVALKLLPRPLATKGRIARFRAERQILATLEHPHIGRLLDGGVSEEGFPYLVMEHVDGVPLTTYCAERHVSLEERVRLLKTVCEAVQYAHGKLVVHRDLKPSNILVTQEGQVKLLDFGIAKLLDEEAVPGEVPLTRTGEQLMTPEYAAPEQVRGEPVTVATDVYQLGVLAYEVLAGQRPFRVAGRRLSAIERAVLEQEPARPSAAVPAEWERRLRGDLDVIVLKALRKEPARRYATAGALGDDLERYLGGHPVEARPSTLGYRTRKFARRHRLALGAGLAVLMAALVVLVLLFRQRSVVIEQRNRAQAEAAKAEQVSGFLIELFEASAPDQARGEDLTALDLLERGVERARGLDEQPDVQAQMFEVIGEVYRAYGGYGDAGPLLAQALQIRSGLHEAAHPDVARTLRLLASLRKDEGAFDEADSLYGAAVAMLRTLHGVSHADLATALDDWSILKSQQGDLQEAEALAREALTMRQALFDPPHQALANSLNDLAGVYYRLGRLGEAGPLYEESLGMHRQLLGDDHPHVAALLNNLANLYDSMGRYGKAEAFRRDALALDRKLYGDQHRYVASDLVSLGSILSSQGNHAEAEVLLREAVDMQRALLGPDHPDVATAMDHLGMVLAAQKKAEAAERVLLQALALRREHFDGAHPRMVNTFNALGNLYEDTARYEQAETFYRRAITVHEEMVGDAGRKLAMLTSNLGKVLRQQQRWDDAEAAYERSLALYRDLSPFDTLGTAEAYADLATTLAQEGAWEAAGTYLEAGRRLFEAGGRMDHPALERATMSYQRASRR